MNKESFRKDLLAKRIEFSNNPNFYLHCQQICQNLETFLATIPALQKQIIGGYWPVKGEVDLSQFYDNKNNLAFPRLLFIKNQFEIEYAKVSSINDLTQSTLNFKEPNKKASLCFPHVIIIPGIGYDKKYNRLGYGKGHFDKFIAKAKKSNYIPIKIGICFDFQLLETLPIEAHDQPMDIIITESRIIKNAF